MLRLCNQFEFNQICSCIAGVRRQQRIVSDEFVQILLDKEIQLYLRNIFLLGIWCVTLLVRKQLVGSATFPQYVIPIFYLCPRK